MTSSGLIFFLLPTATFGRPLNVGKEGSVEKTEVFLSILTVSKNLFRLGKGHTLGAQGTKRDGRLIGRQDLGAALVMAKV